MFPQSYCKIIFLLIVLTSIYSKASDDMKPPAGRGIPFHAFFEKVTREQFDSCLTQNGITIDHKKKGPPEMNSKRLCVDKCIMTAAGLLSDDGEIFTDVLKNIEEPKFITKDELDKTIKCMDAIEDKIATCDEVKKIVDCMPHKKPMDRPSE